MWFQRVWRVCALFALAAVVVVKMNAQSLPLSIVPGAYGFGTNTRAAYGGSIAPTVYRVTNLNDSGAGSLRAALTASGPRVVIFEISGTITLQSRIDIFNPYLTVAGQTAPSPGITLRKNGLAVFTNDVLLQHFRIRPGAANCNDALIAWGEGSLSPFNIVLDHMSVSWGQDENLAVLNSGRPINLTVWRSIIAEGLHNTPGMENCPGGGTSPSHGALIYSNTRGVSISQTLLASNVERNPYPQGGTSTVLVNNLIYNWYGPWGFFFSQYGSKPWFASTVGNRFVPGPKTYDPAGTAYMFAYSKAFGEVAGNKIYRADNTLGSSPYGPIVNQYNGLSYDPNVGSPPAEAPLPAGVTPLASTQVEAFVLSNSGARPTDRDVVDTRLVQDVQQRTGKFISSESEVGGYPALPVNLRPLTLPSNPHSVTSSGYTVLETWLQQFAQPLEGQSTTETTPTVPTGIRIVP